jgi:hypothetical protein
MLFQEEELRGVEEMDIAIDRRHTETPLLQHGVLSCRPLLCVQVMVLGNGLGGQARPLILRQLRTRQLPGAL